MAGYGFPEHVRVTVGTAEENRRFVDALEKALRMIVPQSRAITANSEESAGGSGRDVLGPTGISSHRAKRGKQ